MIREVARHEKTLIPEDFEYADLTGLTLKPARSWPHPPEESGPGQPHPRGVPLGRGQLSIALAGPHLIQNTERNQNL